MDTPPLSLTLHALPFWFLALALFLPRISLVLAWLQGDLTAFHLGTIVPVVFWALLPRVLMLYLIYLDQGISGWFLLHLVVGLVVWAGSGHTVNRRRRRRLEA